MQTRIMRAGTNKSQEVLESSQLTKTTKKTTTTTTTTTQKRIRDDVPWEAVKEQIQKPRKVVIDDPSKNTNKSQEEVLLSSLPTKKKTTQAKRKDVRYDVPWETIKEQIENGNVTAGQFILDFAVIGFPKCGTSTMSKL
jgi:DNA-binding transcriptional regulator YdaS (Cro superfamily)